MKKKSWMIEVFLVAGIMCLIATSALMPRNTTAEEQPTPPHKAAQAPPSPMQPNTGYRRFHVPNRNLECPNGLVQFSVITEFWHGSRLARIPELEMVYLEVEVFGKKQNIMEDTPFYTQKTPMVFVPQLGGDYFSVEEVPFSFPMQPGKYTIRVSMKSPIPETRIRGEDRETTPATILKSTLLNAEVQ